MGEVERETRQLGAIQENVRSLGRDVANLDRDMRQGLNELRTEVREGLNDVRGEGRSTRRLLIGMLSSVLIALLITLATQYGGGG